MFIENCYVFQALKATLIDTEPAEKERLALFVLEILEQCDSGVQSELLCHDIIRQLTSDLPLPGTEAKSPDTQIFVPPDFSKCAKLKFINMSRKYLCMYNVNLSAFYCKTLDISMSHNGMISKTFFIFLYSMLTQ